MTERLSCGGAPADGSTWWAGSTGSCRFYNCAWIQVRKITILSCEAISLFETKLTYNSNTFFWLMEFSTFKTCQIYLEALLKPFKSSILPLINLVKYFHNVLVSFVLHFLALLASQGSGECTGLCLVLVLF